MLTQGTPALTGFLTQPTRAKNMNTVITLFICFIMCGQLSAAEDFCPFLFYVGNLVLKLTKVVSP
jgi:hypothetical protein